jgi:hypothetical protein
VALTCTFLSLLSHPSQQIAGVDSISLVISLVRPEELACGPLDSGTSARTASFPAVRLASVPPSSAG